MSPERPGTLDRHTAGARRVAVARATMFARLGNPDALANMPATVELRPAAQLDRPTWYALGGAATSLAMLVYAALIGDQLYWIPGDPLDEYLAHLADLAWSAWVLVPAAFLLAAALLRLQRGRRPEWVRISLSRQEVTVEGPAGTWIMPVAEFTAVALETRPGNTYVMSRLHTPRMWELGFRGPDIPLVRRETLRWIELRHPDPQRSVPIWARQGDAGEEVARRAALRFADRLGLPVAR